MEKCLGCSGEAMVIYLDGSSVCGNCGHLDMNYV